MARCKIDGVGLVELVSDETHGYGLAEKLRFMGVPDSQARHTSPQPITETHESLSAYPR